MEYIIILIGGVLLLIIIALLETLDSVIKERNFFREKEQDTEDSMNRSVRENAELVIRLAKIPEVLQEVASRLHNETGPAIHLTGGQVVYFWRGVHVPGWIITNPERITPGRIVGEDNLEIRRIMLERYGLGKFLTSFGAEKIHEDKRGILWELDLRRATPGAVKTSDLQSVIGQIDYLSARPQRFVQVKDSSSGREFFIGVPLKCKTATGAVAWTFRLKPKEYARLKEET